jgi:hypothetical protein
MASVRGPSDATAALISDCAMPEVLGVVDAGVPQDPPHAMRVDAGAQHQRRRCLAQVVELHRPRERSHSETCWWTNG